MKFICIKILLSLLIIAGKMKYGEGRKERFDGTNGERKHLKEGEGKLNETTYLNVKIEVPTIVRAGDTAVLRCSYNLSAGDSLYTMKWYKGSHEFYRYTPKESPNIKTFPVPGLHIDLSQSNATQLTLKKVDLNLTSRYSCEVTTDFPDFTTAYKTSFLYVVAYPEKKPEIRLARKEYAVGDLLEANCTSYRSKPAANLTWLINGHLANPNYFTVSEEEESRDAAYKKTSLSEIRFTVRQSYFINGRLRLSCLAKIHNLYHQTSEETISEGDRPKISSVVDNSSSTGSGTNSRFQNSGSSHSNAGEMRMPASGLVLLTFFISNVLFGSCPSTLVHYLSETWRRRKATKFSSTVSLGVLMR